MYAYFCDRGKDRPFVVFSLPLSSSMSRPPTTNVNPFAGGVGSNQVAAQRAALKVAEKQAASPWLNAWTDPIAGIKTTTACFHVCDLFGDGDNRLVVATMTDTPKIKIFRGTAITNEILLLDTPVAMSIYYPEKPSNSKDKSAMMIPNIALASGPYIFIYRNLRPQARFQIPRVDMPTAEKDAWLRFKSAVGAAPSTSSASTPTSAASASTGSTERKEPRFFPGPASTSTSTPTSTSTSTAAPSSSSSSSSLEGGLTSPSESPTNSGGPSTPIGSSSKTAHVISQAVTRLHEQLTMLRDGDVAAALTFRSLDFLALKDDNERREYALAMRNQPLDVAVPITCMEALPKSSSDEKALSHLVVGTEHGKLLFLNLPVTDVMFWVDLPSAPTQLAVKGVLDTDYRVYAACRDSKIYCARKDKPLSVAVSCDSHLVDFVVTDKYIFTATMNHNITAYSHHGRKDYVLSMPCAVSSMTVLKMTKVQTVEALLVGLKNGEVRLYNGRQLLNTIPSADGNIVTAMRFAAYGREDASLLLGYKSGMLSVKMLARQMTFGSGDTVMSLPPPEQDIPLSIPTKTTLFVQQTYREKDQAAEMHETFQRDLCKLRLTTARALVNVLTEGKGPIATSAMSGLRVDVQVKGQGPLFTLVLEVTSTAPKPTHNLLLSLSYNTNEYAIERSSLLIPVIIPSLQYPFEFPIEARDPTAAPGSVRAFATSSSSPVPLLAAVVTMPPCQGLETVN